MNFNDHSELEGLHAFLSPSKYHWMNYDEDKLSKTYLNHLGIEKGTKLHELASTCIEMGTYLEDNGKTLNSFVNDSIEHGMETEQPLYYSENCFGTADSISFDGQMLKIFDLKTGQTPAKVQQLEVYAALFCLEYGIDPEDIEIELRIYQFDDIQVAIPDSKVISDIMNKIIEFDLKINSIKEGLK